MKVIEALEKDKPTLSFEFFPPKTERQEKKLFEVLGELKKFNPDFCSVTCGALGTNRDKTIYWVKEIRERFGIEPIAHLTCVALTADEIKRQVEELEAISVKNILALRGDPPRWKEKFVAPKNGFRHGSELVAFIKKLNPDFCVGVAGYPEGHPESQSIEEDTEYLKQKVQAGADYIITQLFFESSYFFGFLERTEKAGIKVPILPGIMPITSLSQIEKVTQVCRVTIPKWLRERLEKYETDQKSVRQIGIETTVSLCNEIKKAKIPGMHFFVMNQSGPITRILKQL